MESVKTSMKAALLETMKKAAEEREVRDGDFRGENGLLYCGKCGKPRQSIINLPEGLIDGKETMIVRTMCDCDKAAEEERQRQEKYRRKMQTISKYRDMSLMDDKYQEATFSGYKETGDNEKALKTAKKYVESFDEMLKENQGIIFYGPVGTGKSFTAACIANELLDRCVPVIMTSFVKILQNIQGSEEESHYIKTLNDAKLLVLDDLGTERNTDYALEKVYNIIDSRSRAALPMILTTNLELSEMMQTTDIRYRRIYDRIFETCYPVNIPGESFRRQEAAQRFDRMQKLMEG